MTRGKPPGPKTRCNGQWTEARYHNFIKNALRMASRKWAPIPLANKLAATTRGFFICALCKEECPTSFICPEKGKRKKNKIVDHIEPIIDPAEGFESWDKTIDRMFCEITGLQVTCHSCHQGKCKEEIAVAVARRAKEKEDKLKS